MEMGLGFAIGAVVGAGVGLLFVTLIAVIRRGAGRGRSNVASSPSGSRNVDAAGATRIITAVTRESGRIDGLEDKESKLGKAVHEVRDLVLKVADIVSHTNNASGEAAKAFNLAKANLDSIDFSDSDNLFAAHAVLLGEVNSVIKTNEKLQSELESAKTGIAEQRRQIEELRQAVRIDSLTGLPNRVAFDERLNELLKRLDRTEEIFSLLLLDIDFFKRINDTHGHVNGDRILKGIASKIRANIRANDHPARYGGEEFAVLLPATGAKAAIVIAERMRQDIAKTTFKLDGNDIHVTISGGLSESRKGQRPEEVISNSDQALYKSKAEGRNQISVREQ